VLVVCVLACVRLPPHSFAHQTQQSEVEVKQTRVEESEEERQEIGRKTERKESR
jgi:hypothetical protein